MKDDKKSPKYGIASLVIRAEKSVIRIAPAASIIMIFSLLSGAALAGVNTLYISRLLNDIAKISDQVGLKNQVLIDAVILILIYLLRKVSGGLFEGAMIRVDAKTMYYLQIELRKKCTKLPLYIYEDSEKIDELERAKNALNETRISDLTLSFYNILSEVVQVVTVSVVLFTFNEWLVAISLFSVAPYFIIRYIRGNMFYELKWFQAKDERKKNYLYKLFNNKQSVKELRVFSVQEYIKEKWRHVRDDINKETWAFGKKDIFSLLICDILKTLGYLLSVVFVVRFTIRGEINVGDLSAAMLAFLNFQNSMKYFLINMARVPECASFTKDFYQFMDLEEENCVNASDDILEGIQLKDVSFRYPNKDAVIKGVSFEIKPGEKVVIIGENGSGKTTLTKLMLGLYSCEEGMVRYGKQDIKDIDKNDLYERIAVVNQEFVKYCLTIRQNITLNEMINHHEDEKILEIIRRLQLEDILGEEGLDTMLGAEFGGKELSQGQWQKLAIARAIYRKSEILFLDEPTSALDPMIENEILLTFLDMMKEKTAVIVSHRVGLCREVDKIIVMKDGNICEIGSHDQLMSIRGEYYQLYSAQSQWYC